MSSGNKKSYKDTLNLPRTKFPMKADLKGSTLDLIKKWYGPEGEHAKELTSHVRSSFLLSNDKPEDFLLHDGPPYANGPIHVGHMLNKSLKDFILRFKHLYGYGTPFTVGWDCHGLPIESKVLKDAKESPDGSNMSLLGLREACKAEASKWVSHQAEEMERLSLFADPKNINYKTMDPSYESAVLDVFAAMLDSDIVYRELKPVHWSVENKTVLADAELEYQDIEVESAYVLFPFYGEQLSCLDVNLKCKMQNAYCAFVAWTTTPWTLPANEALAVNPEIEYSIYNIQFKNTNSYFVCATNLAEKVFDGFAYTKELSFFGYELNNLSYQYPFGPSGFMKKVLKADFVTSKSGTGIVHIAPAHGAEDYQLGQENGLKVNCPVTEDNLYDNSAPDFLRGVHVRKGDKLILDWLGTHNLLFNTELYKHSYPHDWRSHKPVITRATYQWFISVDKEYALHRKESLRGQCINALNEVTFFPPNAKARLVKMLQSRPDWCISRQRNWGLPIPVLYYGGQPLLTPETVRLISYNMKNNGGSNYWYSATVEDLLKNNDGVIYDPSTDEAAPEWAKQKNFKFSFLDKGFDTFDVWFESGCSWNAVYQEPDVLPDLYLEGNDQHRGWFQSSLLTSVFMNGRAPFKQLVTHGFCLDKNARPMHKHLGNAINMQDALDKYGADVLRWWVSSLDYTNDVKCDDKFFAEAEKEYNKIRNTVRFILSNLYDFDPKKDSVPLNCCSLNTMIVEHGNFLSFEIHESMENYNIANAHKEIYRFCQDDLSAVYFTAVKDRLYCSAADSYERRSTQTALYNLGLKLLYLLTPFTPSLASEILEILSFDSRLDFYGKPSYSYPPSEKWQEVISSLRPLVMQALQSSGIKNPLDAGVKVYFNDSQKYLLDFQSELADLFGMSRIELELSPLAKTFGVEIMDLREEPRCERSWKRDGTVKVRSNGDMLSDRDAKVLGV